MQVGDVFDLDIEKMSYGGAGIARLNSLVCFVRPAAPGDHLRVRITSLKKRFAEAVTEQILVPGPQRRQEPCPYVKDCGACQWQHIDYPEQLRQKEQIFLELVARSKLQQIPPLSPSLYGQQWSYRNRVQLRSQRNQIGYLQTSSHQLVAIDRCLIADPRINQALPALASQNPGNELQKLEVLIDDHNNLRVRKNKKHGEVDGFSQVHSEMNQAMQNWVQQQVEQLMSSDQIDEVYDLYAGNGNFARHLEKLALPLKLFCVEKNPAAVQRGQKLAGDQSKISWLATEVEKQLRSLKTAATSLLIVDPPRTGCNESFISTLEHTAARHLLYISCNPSTWIRDLERLQRIRSLQIDEVRLIDMFPQTYHIEILSRIRLL